MKSLSVMLLQDDPFIFVTEYDLRVHFEFFGKGLKFKNVTLHGALHKKEGGYIFLVLWQFPWIFFQRIHISLAKAFMYLIWKTLSFLAKK